MRKNIQWAPYCENMLEQLNQLSMTELKKWGDIC